MKRLNVLLPVVLFAPALFGQSVEDTGSSRAVTVYTQFEDSPSELSIQNMKSELADIMAPLGVQFAWRSLDKADGREIMAEIVVVRFRGDCRVDTWQSNGLRERALGWTHVSDGEILPFTDVNCNRIRDLLGEYIAGTGILAERAKLMGRAMARVVAHEMYHFFANTSKHAASGVAKAAFSRSELAAEHLNFENKQIELVRKGRLRNLIGQIPLATAPAGGG
ncbi:MAG: hypothetical protein U0Q18_28970 [Bryobacteraceae bacterium]